MLQQHQIVVQISGFRFCQPISFLSLYEIKLYVSHTRTNIRYHFFACRIVKVWNSLPADIVDFSSLCRFRWSLHNIDFSEFLTIQ